MSLVKQRKISIEFIKLAQPLSELEIDPKYIHEIFKNIISNAIKYTKDKVTISFEKKDSNIIFARSDNGIGIPKNEQYKIFTKFYIASNVSEAGIKGTGLGLSIAKVLIERMGGRIWFESEENERTTFYVSLPFLI
ncbi:MAG: ATP-binding protein [Patescibacteria group bacterium]|nr:ATP-binding protein [Patescibacteria group bacterium]